MRDHCFVPGDPNYGWERQCSVKVPMKEAGQMVTTHCGYPPENHPATTDPIHSKACATYVSGFDICTCWAKDYR